MNNVHRQTNQSHSSPLENTEKSGSLVITGITIIDIHTGLKTVQDMEIKDEKIVQLGLQGSLSFPQTATMIDGEGQYAIPGLCDMHVHLTAWPEFKDKISTLFIANGVTSVRDMGGQLDDILEFRHKANQQDAIAPRLWIAGPIIDGSPPIMKEEPQFDMPNISVTVDTPCEAIQMVDELAKQGIDFIKGYEMLRPEVFKALLQQAQSHDLQAAGHLPIRMTIPEVLAIGQYDIQHLGGMCSGMKYECVAHPKAVLDERMTILDKRTDENGVDLVMEILKKIPIKASEQDEERRAALIQLFVEKSTWHTPTLVNGVGFRLLGLEDDANWQAAFRYLPKKRQALAKAFLKDEDESIEECEGKRWTLETAAQMHTAGVKFLAGTDSPPAPIYVPGSALHFELDAMVQAGLSPLEALQTATINPAEFFDLTDELGSIEVGKCADIILLEADPLIYISNSKRISSVISRGRFFDQQALSDMLASVVDK